MGFRTWLYDKWTKNGTIQIDMPVDDGVAEWRVVDSDGNVIHSGKSTNNNVDAISDWIEKTYLSGSKGA